MWGDFFNTENPLIGAHNIWVLLSFVLAVSSSVIWCERRYAFVSKISGVMFTLVAAMAFANLGIIPSESSVYDFIWTYVLPVSIPLLLFKSNIRNIGRESVRLLVIFIIGATGTTVGAFAGFFVLKDYIPELASLAAVFTGSCVGGAVNFASLGETFKVSDNMLSAAAVADNLLFVLYFFALSVIPGFAFFKRNFLHIHEPETSCTAKDDGHPKETQLKDFAYALTVSIVIVTTAQLVAGGLSALIPDNGIIGHIFSTLLGNRYFWIATLSMVAATFFPKQLSRINGADGLGSFMIYLFCFALGVQASIIMVFKLSPLLFVFALFVDGFNILFSFALGKLFKFKLEEIILASNANIGGPTTAAVLAMSKGYRSLVGPVMLVGTFGYVLGTYLGLLVGGLICA